jgi:DNA-binding NtrC family response regulator
MGQNPGRIDLQRNNSPAAMVVNDRKDLNALFLVGLSLMGLKMHQFNDSFHAMDAFQKQHFNLVFTDIDIPGAWTLARYIKKTSPEFPPVVMILKQQKDNVRHMIDKACIDTVMFRPFELSDIRKTVEWLSGRSYCRDNNSH